jgi:betaine-aldehyde dehydrogenase
VFADADFDLAAAGASNAIFQNAGQTCSAGSRLLVERRAHDAFVDRLVSRARTMTVGPGVSDPDLGPIISKRQLETIERYVAIGTQEGAKVAAGGKRPANPALPGGFYFEPTLLDAVQPDMRVAQEEIFGPVLAVIPYDSPDDAVRIANDSDYGLAGSVWTSDVDAGLEIARRVRTGTYGVNGSSMNFAAPFGGFKQSGIGRELGPEGLEEYLEFKGINMPAGWSPTEG